MWNFYPLKPQRWSTSPVMGRPREVKRYAPWSSGSPRDAPEVRVHLRFLPPRWSTVMNPTTILCHTNPCWRTIMLYQYFCPALYLMGPIVLLLMALLLRTVPEGSDFVALWLVCSRSLFHSAIKVPHGTLVRSRNTITSHSHDPLHKIMQFISYVIVMFLYVHYWTEGKKEIYNFITSCAIQF